MDLADSFLPDVTSPSILQDITLDQSEMDARCAPGLTMKEYDDQLKKLTAENFNLKLKLFFFDEKMTKMDGLVDKELIRENVEQKVEIERLSKEVTRQANLLSESLDALLQQEKEYTERLEAREAELAAAFVAERKELEVRAGALEIRLRLMEAEPAQETDCDSSNWKDQVQTLEHKLHESQQRVQTLEQEGSELQRRVMQLQQEANEAKHLTANNERLQQQVENYQKELEEVRRSYQDTRTEETTRQLEAELMKVKASYAKSCDAIKSFMHKVLEERKQNQLLKEQLVREQTLRAQLQLSPNAQKADLSAKQSQLAVEGQVLRLQELEAEVAHLKGRLEEGHGDLGEHLAAQLADKQSQIDGLHGDLRQRTQCLQDLVNTELREKNSQIEKLEARLRAEQGFQRHAERLREERAALRHELARLQDREAPLREACGALTERLEELAGFLDSLLTDRKMNGEQHQAIKHALDRSRELSRRLTLSLDETLLCGELMQRLTLGTDETLLDQSEHSRKDSSAASQLLEQITLLSQMVREREKEGSRGQSEPLVVTPRDGELRWLELQVAPDEELDGRRQTRRKSDRPDRAGRPAKVVGPGGEGSESEAWSEPDRSVSLARMGHLDAASLTPLRLSKCADSSASSEDTLNENRSSGKRTRSVEPEARRLQTKVKALEEANKELQEQLTLAEARHAILARLSGESAPQLLQEIQQSLSELEETRECCAQLRSDLATAQADLMASERVCEHQRTAIAALEEAALDCELKLVESDTRAVEVSAKLAAAEALRTSLEQQVSEISKKMAAAQAWELRSKCQVREAERHLDTCERMLLEKTESEVKVRELQLQVECLQRSVAEKQKELVDTESSKALVEAKVKEEGARIQWMEGKLRELEEAMDQCERETQAKIGLEVARRVEDRVGQLKQQWVPRVELEKTRRRLEAMEEGLQASEALQEGFKAQEEALLKRIARLEAEKRELRVTGSELELRVAQLEMDKARQDEEWRRVVEMNRDQAEELKKAVEKQTELLRNLRQAEETIRGLEKQAEEGSTVSASLQDFLWARNLNTSPDLGIESDQGRFSSLEHQDSRVVAQRDVSNGNASELEVENAELKRRVAELGRSLEDTLAELTAANHQKRQMERAICKQLHKTHHILKKARINFEMHESDSERP